MWPRASIAETRRAAAATTPTAKAEEESVKTLFDRTPTVEHGHVGDDKVPERQEGSRPSRGGTAVDEEQTFEGRTSRKARPGRGASRDRVERTR
jgi:hypothetical protein